jgi:hypothetical protein
MDTELTKLRRARSRCHLALKRAEMQVEAYAFKLAELEAHIPAISPELELPHRFRQPNPVFAPGELPRPAQSNLREANGPMPIAAIAVRALAMKGIVLPDPTRRRRTRTKLREALGKLRKRAVLGTVVAETGRGTG